MRGNPISKRVKVRWWRNLLIGEGSRDVPPQKEKLGEGAGRVRGGGNNQDGGIVRLMDVVE